MSRAAASRTGRGGINKEIHSDYIATANLSLGITRDEKYPVFRGSYRQPLDAHRQSPSCFLARQEMNLPAMLPRHMKDGFVERG